MAGFYAVRIKRSHPTLLKEDGRVLMLPDGSDTVYWISSEDIRY